MNETKPETLRKEITPWVLQESLGQGRWEELIDRRELKQRSWPCRVAYGDHYQPTVKWSSLCKPTVTPEKKVWSRTASVSRLFAPNCRMAKGLVRRRMEAFIRWGNINRFQRSGAKSMMLIGNGWTSLILDKMPETPCKLLALTVAVVVA